MNKTIPSSQPVRPFLKWSGGKFRLLHFIKPALPPGKRLLEPFVGAGSIFLNTDYSCYLVNDLNPDLINLYKFIQKDSKHFIKKAKPYFKGKYNNPEQYARLRTLFNKTRASMKRSALFLYLNRHGFNGLCRYNSSKTFNVPFGHYKILPYFPQKELEYFAIRAQKTEFSCLPFEIFLKKARKGDVVYCDPPYLSVLEKPSFENYTGVGFDVNEQKKLVECAGKLVLKNIPIIISNHDLPETRRLYRDADEIQAIQVNRSIGVLTSQNKQAQELIAIYNKKSQNGRKN